MVSVFMSTTLDQDGLLTADLLIPVIRTSATAVHTAVPVSYDLGYAHRVQ